MLRTLLGFIPRYAVVRPDPGQRSAALCMRECIIRSGVAVVVAAVIAACSDVPQPIAPELSAASMTRTVNAAAIRSHFVVGPLDFIVPAHLACIDEDVTIYNLGVVLTFDVVETGSGNTITKALITWPEHRFYLERQNGLRYYQSNNARSKYHEIAGPTHLATIHDFWQLEANDGSRLKIGSQTRIEFDETGDVVDIKFTGACPYF